MAEDSTHHTSEQPSESSDNKHIWYKDRVLLLTVPTVLALDQLTKYVVKTNLRLGESWPREGLVRITHGTNTGTAFGLFPDQTFLLIIASIIAIGFLVYFYKAHALPSPVLRLAIGLQLGGAFGNLLDRVTVGAVVDFIDIGWWPIFNIADSSIVVGMTILVGALLLGDRKGQPDEGSESQDSGSSEGADR
jgi:signal peptidase II